MRLHDARFETADRDAIRAHQLARIQALLAKASATSPFYRAHWRGVDVEAIDSLEAFAARIPTVEKRDFMADQAAAPPFGTRHAHALGLGEPYCLFVTSGTTGQGVEVHVQTADELKASGEIYRYQFAWAGMRRGDLVFLTMPVTLLGGGRIEYTGAMAAGLSVAPVGNYDADTKIELIRRFRPTALIGTTSYLGHLAAVADRLPPADGVTHLFTGAEGSGHAYLERLEGQWRAAVYDRYGSTQSGNDHMFSCEAGIGKRDRPGMLHNIEPMVFFEVVDPETGRHVADGEAGEIVLTSLYHTETPLIRCRMRDRAVFRDPRYCGCGRPFAGVEIASIHRVDDMKKVKGVNIWPQAVEDVLFAVAEVDDFEIVLASDARESDVATARIVPKAPPPPDLAETIGERLRRRIGIGFAVEMLRPGSLARDDRKVRRWRDERLHRQGIDG